MLERLLDFLYPPVCEVCQVRLLPQPEAHTLGAEYFCSECDPLLDSDVFLPRTAPPEVAHPGYGSVIFCGRCGDFAPSSAPATNTCVLCALFPLELNRLRSIVRYSERFEAALKAYKYREHRRLGSFFASLLGSGSRETETSIAEAKPDIIIPIPSSAASIRRRGFHHTASIAADLSRQYEVPMLRFALRSVRDRKSQARLSPEKRSQNMFEAFAADRRFVHGKRVLLVDDLLTSGASMNEAARTLKESGAQTVDGVTVARSKYFGRNRVLLQLQKFVDT